MSELQSRLAKAPPAVRGIPRKTESGPAPVSFAQQRLWFLDQLRPNDAAYNMMQVLRLAGRLDVPVLERAFNEIRRRHDVLRANFDCMDEQPVQIVSPFQPVSLPVVDCSNLTKDQVESACQRAIDRVSRPPFNLKSDPLLRAALVRLGPMEHVLVVVTHHIISDGWSTRLLKKELASLYEAYLEGKPSPLPELPIQYSDYARWQREWLRGAVLETQLSYWKKHLAGSVPVLELPRDRPRPNMQTSTGGVVGKVLSAELLESLQLLSQRHNATLFMTLLAAFQILLHRMSGQEDIVIGAPIAGRTQLETEKLLGIFVNTLAVWCDLSGNPTFEKLLGRVRSVVLDAITHQDLPFEMLVEELQPERNLSHSPLFQVMLNVFLLDDPELKVPGLIIETLPPPKDESKFDLTLYVVKERQDLRVKLRYNADLFDAVRMEEMLDELVQLVQQIVAAPDRAIGSYSLVTPKSCRFLPDPTLALAEPHFGPVTDEFLSRVRHSPKHKAVTQAGRSWTYEELSDSSTAIANALLSRHLKRGEVVAVAGPRSFGLVASMVAVLMSGGVLLTVDRSLPAKRQRLILSEARARYLLYIGEWRWEDDWLRELDSLEIIPVTRQAKIGGPSTVIPLPEISPDSAAYIFFTSGTTGVPKGVLGCHKGLSQFLAWQSATFDIGPHDHCAQLTSLSFEVILRDIFLPLVSGATLCLPDEADDPASGLMLAWMDRQGITLFHAVPTVVQTWLNTAPHGLMLRTLRWAFFGGEPLTDGLVKRWRDIMPGTGRIVNLYGPAETTLAKCFHVILDEPSHGIQHLGRPLPHAQVLVLNGNGRLCGVGEPGQIVIRTPFRTHGYINAPEEQHTRFVKNPFRDDADDLIYFTGDRGRYRPDGVLEFLGRIDDQVKIRGVRVEPAEVTAILGTHPSVKACFVRAAKDPLGENILVAYVVGTKAASTSALRGYLAERALGVMVPSAFVFLDALPVTPNGKIDRRALPAPDLVKHDTRRALPPRTPTERALKDIWCRILKLEQVGVQENFFDLGGHSLLATQVVSQIRRDLSVDLPLHAIFVKPTIESLALYLLEQRAFASGSAEFEEQLAEVESLSDETAEREFGTLDQESQVPGPMKGADPDRQPGHKASGGDYQT